MSDNWQDFYEPPLCPKCGAVVTVTKCREEEGVVASIECDKCGHEESNLMSTTYKRRL